MRLEELSKVIHTLASHAFNCGRIEFPPTCKNLNQSSASFCITRPDSHPVYLFSLQKPDIDLILSLGKTKRAALDSLMDESRRAMIVEDENRLLSIL